MSTTQVHARRLSVVAVAACGLVGLSACSGGSSDSASSPSRTTSSAKSTSSSASSTTSTSSAASSSARSSAATSSSASGKSTSGKSTPASSTKASKSTKAKPKTDPVAACKTANTKSNQAIGQWNAAVKTQSASKLDSAAHNFRTVAGGLRKLPATAGDKGFTPKVQAVANDLDAMAKNRFAGKSVDPSTYNTDSEKLRSYCQKVLTSQ